MPEINVTLPTLHADQVRAYLLKEDRRATDPSVAAAERELWAANKGARFKVIRCGRRWGKTELGKVWVGDGSIKGVPCGWFAPDYKKLSEAYEELRTMLDPVVTRSSKTDGVIRLVGGGRIDFWTLEDESAGRSRKYKRVVIDEGAFTKPNMLNIWKKSIKPALFDLRGQAWVTSNTNGVDPANFMYAICNDPQHGFVEYHAPTINNPTIPALDPEEMDGLSPFDIEVLRTLRRTEEIELLRKREHPLVFAQEYGAEFVDWSGVAFFEVGKLLVDGQPVGLPPYCDVVFAVIDTASKTGTEHDGTAVTYWAYTKTPGASVPKLVLLDWDAIQIEGSLLETWLPVVLENTKDWARKCKARYGSVGAWIEDKSTGIVLLQQAKNKGLPARAIDSKLTALGKDERAIDVSGYHYRGEVKIYADAYNKTTDYKGTHRNHLISQVTGFRIGDKDAAKRADDLLDSYCYGLAISLGNNGGF